MWKFMIGIVVGFGLCQIPAPWAYDIGSPFSDREPYSVQAPDRGDAARERSDQRFNRERSSDYNTRSPC